MSEQPSSVSPVLPNTVRWAGVLVTLEGVVALVLAAILVVRGLLGHDQSIASSYGTAAWAGILGGGVLAGGIALLRGRRWGRSLAVLAQLLLLPVVWSLMTGSDQPVYGTLLGLVVVPALLLLFSGPTSRWMAAAYGVDEEFGEKDAD